MGFQDQTYISYPKKAGDTKSIAIYRDLLDDEKSWLQYRTLKVEHKGRVLIYQIPTSLKIPQGQTMKFAFIKEYILSPSFSKNIPDITEIHTNYSYLEGDILITYAEEFQ